MLGGATLVTGGGRGRVGTGGAYSSLKVVCGAETRGRGGGVGAAAWGVGLLSLSQPVRQAAALPRPRRVRKERRERLEGWMGVGWSERVVTECLSRSPR